MTPQEQDMIQGLITRVTQTQLPEKDADAEQLLQQSLGRNPDALYILAQTVLVQKYALEQSQKQLTDLKSQLDQSRQQAQSQEQPHHTSFLGSLLGRSDPPPPPPYQQTQAPQYAPVPNYAPGPGQSSPQYGAQSPGPSQGGGFLRSALQTATGVAAGALAFQGIESLMHGFGGGGGFGGGQGFGGFGSEAPREEVVNNYYGDSDRDNTGGGLSSDIEDRRDDNTGNQFADSTQDDSSSLDDDNSSDANQDDSSFDSSSDSGGDDGSFDSGGDDSSFS